VWRQRPWNAWLRANLDFPFQGLVGTPPDGRPRLMQVDDLMPGTEEQTQKLGIYFAAGAEAMLAGGTCVTPLDVASNNRLVLAEYHAYRKKVGPPPGTLGLPPFTTLAEEE